MSADALPDQGVREGFGPDACEEDRVDGPTRDRLQRLYGSVDLLAERSKATAEGQYEDIEAVEIIIGDLREDRARLHAEVEALKAAVSDALEMLCMSQCPAYEDNGTCTSDCYQEPACQCDEPTEGWIVAAIQRLADDDPDDAE